MAKLESLKDDNELASLLEVNEGGRSSFGITDLPADLLKACLSFVGPGHYPFVALVCRQFQEGYSNFPKTTKLDSAASSASCAQHCLDDDKLTTSNTKEGVLKAITTKATSTADVKVLKWALDDHSHALDDQGFLLAGIYGHVKVLEWGEENGLDWFSPGLSMLAMMYGHVNLLDWIHQRRPIGCTLMDAVKGGHVRVLDWMNEHGLAEKDNSFVWWAAGYSGKLQVMKWLLENDFTRHNECMDGAAAKGHIHILKWAREHGFQWTDLTCSCAAFGGNLDALKWLHEHGCPWDSETITVAQGRGYLDIVEWARQNGCPSPD